MLRTKYNFLDWEEEGRGTLGEIVVINFNCGAHPLILSA